MTKLGPLHPGEVLREEFLVPVGLSAHALADQCYISYARIDLVVTEEVGINADTALRLGAVFGTTPEFWLNLQSRYDIEKARNEIGDELKTIPALNVH